MGVHPNIGFDKFPKQDKNSAFGGIGARVGVCFNYDASREIGGEVVRNDEEEPGLTIIKLDDNRYVLTTECMWTPKGRDKPAPAHECIACPVEFRSLFASLHNLTVQLRREPTLDARSQRKLVEAEQLVKATQPLIDAHFAAINGTTKEQG